MHSSSLIALRQTIWFLVKSKISKKTHNGSEIVQGDSLMFSALEINGVY